MTRHRKAILLVSLGAAFCALALATGASRKPKTASSATGPTGKEAGSSDGVWIMRPDGAKSCAPGSGESEGEGSQELRAARIPVLDSRKGNDGKMHIQVCGADAGSANLYRISTKDLEKAKALGYQVAPLKGE